MLERHLMSQNEVKIIEKHLPRSGAAREMTVADALWAYRDLESENIDRRQKEKVLRIM